jgi:cytoskeleton protein RodZ
MSIGSKLHQAREEQSLSLDQVAQATRIRLHYLEALEADQFDKLPSTAQLRGFLRAYADYLKLDSSELILELDGASPTTPPQPVSVEPSNIAPQKPTSGEGIFKELGSQLRAQRELMGLSLGDVERHTHIRMHYIKALETGDISHLPSPVQGRGMLSNYAAFLGLDIEAILLRFADGLQADLNDRREARNSPSVARTDTTKAGVPARPSQFKRLFSMDLFVGGFIIVFLLGFSVWGALRISRLNSANVPSPSAPPVTELLLSTPLNGSSATPGPTIAMTSELSPTVVLNSIPITGTVQPELTQTQVIYGATTEIPNAAIQVSIIPSQRAWLRVIVDGETVFEGRVMPGSAYSFAGNQRVELLTGNGSSLHVFFNQQDLGLLGAFGQVVERIFTIEGVQTPTPSVPPTSTPAPTQTETPAGSGTPSRGTVTPTLTPRP